MKTLPNQIDLATLATRLPTGSPGERVDTALAIWEAAGKRLDELAQRSAFFTEMNLETDMINSELAADRARVMSGIIFPAGALSLEVFLSKTTPPKYHKSQREDLFREFLGVNDPSKPTPAAGGFKDGVDAEQWALFFRQWLERRDVEKAKSFHKERSVSASLARYGGKWVKDALAGLPSQTLEMLVENTKRHTGNDRELARKRVQGLIDAGLLVKVDGKLYGIPGPKKKLTNKK